MKEEENKLNKKLDEMFNKLSKTLNSTLNILVMGKVSSGKSSFLNAFFDAEKDKPKFKVGAKSGETTKAKVIEISRNIRIVDTPGLSDINTANSDETKKFIEEEGIDIGILVISGSADSTQKEEYEYLKREAEKVFVVLNKSDNFSSENLKDVLQQWHEQLNMPSDEKIYPVVSRGYDPKDKEIFRGQEYDIEIDKYGRPKTLKGIDEVRNDVLSFLEKNGKDLLLIKELKDKSRKATAIIATACVSAGGAAFAPGSALYIGAIQATAIASLNYLYTGELMSKSNAISVMGVFLAQNTGQGLFVIIKSFLPPTGIVDVAAAIIALSVTAAMLTTIAKLYSLGYSLDDKDKLIEIFKEIKEIVSGQLKNASKDDLIDKDFFMELIRKIIFDTKK